MEIKKIRLTNFKSIYGTQEIDFEELKGMVKLTGPIGAGKTTIAEGILFCLYGTLKDHKNPNLIAWNTRDYKCEMWLKSGKHDIYISRQCYDEMEAVVDGKPLQAPGKKDTQAILEEYYDVPKIAVEKMCVISFNQFGSLASMNPFQTKCFLDDVFGFKTFTEYNNEVVEERRDVVKRGTELTALINEATNHILSLQEKKKKQQEKLANSIDITGLDKKRQDLVEEGKQAKIDWQAEIDVYAEKKKPLMKSLEEWQQKRTECATLGKQIKNTYKTLEKGVCPTCGSQVSQEKLEGYKKSIEEYAKQWHEADDKVKELAKQITEIASSIDDLNAKWNKKINDLYSQIRDIDTKVSTYNSNLKLMKDNFDTLIKEAEEKKKAYEEESLSNDVEQGEWNDLSDLLSKTLRYKLLDNMIPHINSCIYKFLNKLEQNYEVKFDQEFKCHIFVDNTDKEISYKDLSTGQKKTLDICIIFGIIQNVMTSINMNILFCDELMSNMDPDIRDVMLDLMKTTIAKEKTIFIVNHSEMKDDLFDHKMRVSLINKKIEKENIKKSLCGGNVIVHASKYEQIF